MAHPKPFIIKTPPPTLEETAKKLRMSKAEVRKAMELVERVFRKEEVVTTRASSARSVRRRAPATANG